MKMYQQTFLFLFILMTTTISFANFPTMKIVGTTTVAVPLNQQTTIKKSKAANDVKYTLVETVEMSPLGESLLASHMKSYVNSQQLGRQLKFTGSRKINLGMNNVPVLDQGRHNTCSTFSTTGILDSIYGEDLISQLCYLELTHYLSQTSRHLNGWEGNDAYTIFSDLKNYGAITKQFQKSYGCAGVREYPTFDGNNNGYPMPSYDYLRYSQPIMNRIEYNTLLRESEAFTTAPAAVYLVPNIKNVLASGHRVLISMLLDLHYQVGNLGTYKTRRDSWVLTPGIRKNMEKHDVKGRHGLIVIAYDDDAYIKGPDNEQHKGVFTVRNSWGKEAGDNGNYYVSYEYMHSLAYSAIEISGRY